MNRGDKVHEGMILGEHSRGFDLDVKTERPDRSDVHPIPKDRTGRLLRT